MADRVDELKLRADIVKRLRTIADMVEDPSMGEDIAEAATYLAALPPEDVQGLRDRLPDNCDGKEQEAFEVWAKSQGYDMHEHPLHYLFLDPKTNAAREAWNECIRYCRRAALTEPSNGAA